jgi:uncharacterized protein YyaL (SSP411 family)
MSVLLVTPDRHQLKLWGEETIALIRTHFYRPKDRLYRESTTGDQPSYNWSCGVLLSAFAAAARSDAKYRPMLVEYADAIESYWNPAPPVAGFDVLPGATSVDRYYDDNAWMVMALVEAFEVTKNRRYLARAEAALTYVLSGEDERLGGGIVWRESDKASKNTCSNAPSAAACLAVYRHTHAIKLKQKAQSLYDWTKRNLQDPTDHLMWDNIDFQGRVEKTKWSYNTGLMIRAARELGLAEDARTMSTAAVAHWLSADHAIKDEGKFAHLLAENLDKTHQPLVALSLARLNAKSRSSAGFYPSRWDAVATGDKFDLIDQASAARAYFKAAER